MKKNILKKSISMALICSMVLSGTTSYSGVNVFADDVPEAAEEESLSLGLSETAPVGTVEKISENVEKNQ